MNPINFKLVDVFASAPLSGNSLAVFLNCEHLSKDLMQSLTIEMRQFESIFLSNLSGNGASARIFTLEEELPFAGHPVLGAAAVLHKELQPDSRQASWILSVGGREIAVDTEAITAGYRCSMSQGSASFGLQLDVSDIAGILCHTNLKLSDLHPELPVAVVSTGLPYLIVPVTTEALSTVAIVSTGLEEEVQKFGAKFLLFLDPEGLTQRTWDNLGKVEDIATGSAAGPAAAYLSRFYDDGKMYSLRQGGFVGRPSTLSVRIEDSGNIVVTGEVVHVASGVLEDLW